MWDAPATQPGMPSAPPPPQLHPFLTAVGICRTEPDSDTFVMVPPPWLGATGGGLTAGALAALAEVALSTMALSAAGPRQDVAPASLHVEVCGYPLADGCVRPAPMSGPPVLDAVAAPPDIPRLLARAEVVGYPDGDGGGDGGGGGDDDGGSVARAQSRRAPLANAKGCLTTPDGVVLAVASALCTLVPLMPDAALPVGGTAAPPREVSVPEVTSPVDTELALPVAPRRPLLGALGASVEGDGDRTSVRFSPADWLANRLGAVHTAAVCAIVEAAVDTALGRVLPAGSAVQVRSMDMTFLRSVALGGTTEAVATVIHVGRRLAVTDCEIGTAGTRPGVLARVTAARITHR